MHYFANYARLLQVRWSGGSFREGFSETVRIVPETHNKLYFHFLQRVKSNEVKMVGALVGILWASPENQLKRIS